MDHPVFKFALRRAEILLGNRTRLILLVGQIAAKIYSLEDKGKVAQDVKQKMFVLWRLLKAYAKGQYNLLSWKAILYIVAATVYFINPADVIPDIVPLSGFVDDLSILLWTYSSLQSELDRFIQWEKSNIIQI